MQTTATPCHSLAEVKRLMERTLFDPNFLPWLRESPLEAMADLGLKWDPRDVQVLWDPELAEATPDDAVVHPAVTAYRELMGKRLEFVAEMRQGAIPSHPRLAAWRDRAMARSRLELNGPKYQSIVFAPMCIELGVGCSVGCWFCGVSAPKLTDLFLHTPENARLWRETLDVLGDVFGPAARWGFCYWATDPIDNPDYEKFMVDFHDRFGIFPQTTTAQPLKDPERMRRLLALSQERGNRINRFSILTLKQLLQVHKTYSPEELIQVGCLPLHKESSFGKALVGRAREKPNQQAAQRTPGLEADTIACVAGFGMNMVLRTVKLISPCPSSDRWPNGYYVYEEAHFEDATHLRQVIEGMLERYMPLSAAEMARVRWLRTMQVTPVSDGLALKGLHQSVTVRAPHTTYLHRLAQMLEDGEWSADQLSLMLQFEQGVPAHVTYANLENFFKSGWLDEEPAGPVGQDEERRSTQGREEGHV